ncbi:MAG: hypothetical protein H0T79_20885, partial [Deltaproteobacteria bacterium]|nr:hypothetical protein [Deltaproteobacteria bacterium]
WSETQLLHRRLHGDLERYTETKQWTEAIAVIVQLSELETDPIRRAAYCYAAAMISRDELADLDAAIEHCESALDAYFMKYEDLSEEMVPRAMQPFQTIERILTHRGDWKKLERSCRKLIYRMKGWSNRTLQATLYDKLGEIYRSHLKHYSAAVSTFEAAQQLDPENATRTDRAAILAELHVLTGEPLAN